MRPQNRTTDLVQPLDDDGPDAASEDTDSELDWSFDDPELTQQLRAVKAGRGWLLMTVASTVIAVCAAVALVM